MCYSSSWGNKSVPVVVSCRLSHLDGRMEKNYPLKIIIVHSHGLQFVLSSILHSFLWHVQMWRFLAILRGFFHSCLLCTFSFHPFPPTSLPSSLTASCHLFLGLPLNLVVPKFISNTLLGILFSSILCTCPNQRKLFNL